jgi:uncharacterized membrane protein YdbT with pleckstrin-like domain
MAASRGLLAPGEAIVLDLRAHGRALARPFALVPVTVGLAAFVGTCVPSWRLDGVALQGWLRLAVGVLAALALVRWSLLPYLRWRGRRYVVTTARILLREGVLRRAGRDVPLARVDDVTYSCRLVERMFRSGTLVVESGGEHGRVIMRDVPRVAAVLPTVSELCQRAPRADRWAPV